MRKVPRKFTYPWGSGVIIEEASYSGEYHEPSVQLLEYDDGSQSIRFCYYNHSGRFQRNPLMMRKSELKRLKAALKRTPKLRRLLRSLVE
jgi:hypothetical protein